MKSSDVFAMLVLAAAVLSPGRALAYLDPGTGSMLLQGLIAGVAGGLAVVGLYWNKLKGIFSPRNAAKPPPDASAADEDVDDGERS